MVLKHNQVSSIKTHTHHTDTKQNETKKNPHSIIHLSQSLLYLYSKLYSKNSVYFLCDLSLGGLPTPMASVITNGQVMKGFFFSLDVISGLKLIHLNTYVEALGYLKQFHTQHNQKQTHDLASNPLHNCSLPLLSLSVSWTHL